MKYSIYLRLGWYISILILLFFCKNCNIKAAMPIASETHCIYIYFYFSVCKNPNIRTIMLAISQAGCIYLFSFFSIEKL